jgi:hypothetical protein
MPYERIPVMSAQPMDVRLSTPERSITAMGSIPKFTGEAQSWMWPTSSSAPIAQAQFAPSVYGEGIPGVVATTEQVVTPGVVPGVSTIVPTTDVIPGVPEDRGRWMVYGLLGLGALVALWLITRG